MRLLAGMLLLAGALLAADSPTLFYSKEFPGSNPEFVSVTLTKDGHAEYREAVNDDNPLVFQLSPKEAAEVFGLADKLGHFTRPLESNLKVARMGTKTFRWENGAEKHEQKYNYSLDVDAQALQDWFERMVETERHLINLQRTARFDKLGVNQALLDFAASVDRKRVVAPEQFLKILDRIAKNESYLHMARERAASLADLFRNTAGATQ